MTFDPDRLGETSRRIWDWVLARASTMEDWTPWHAVVDEAVYAVPGSNPPTVVRLLHEAIRTGDLERRGRHPTRELRRGSGEPLVHKGAALAERLEQLTRRGPGEISSTGLARREAIIDWLVEENLPTTDLVTKAGKPTALLTFLTKLLTEQDRAAVAAGQLGVEERRLALEETQLADLEAAVTAALTELGVDQAVARPVIARHLLAIEAASTPLADGEQSASSAGVEGSETA